VEGVVTGQQWQGRGVLVTGASGMVGSWLARAMVEHRARVVALVRDWEPQSDLMQPELLAGISVVSGCLEDYRTVERALNEHECDTVFHLGAQAVVSVGERSPLQTFESNVRGTYHVLEACRRLAPLVKRVVVASSDKAYGESAELPYREEMPLRAVNPYDVSKACTDLLAQTYAATYGLPVAVSRCGNINWSRIVPGTIRSLLRGERPVIRGDGLHTRDYIYVRDVVGAFLTLAEQLEPKGLRGEAFNFSTGRQMRVLDLVEAISVAMGRTDLSPIVLNEVHGEIRDQTLSSAKALRVLGWEPACSLEEGLGETVEWYRRYLTRSG
jgi:CDP-glucose 4,6-dehydratase